MWEVGTEMKGFADGVYTRLVDYVVRQYAELHFVQIFEFTQTYADFCH